jgi:hypothetical protein
MPTSKSITDKEGMRIAVAWLDDSQLLSWDHFSQHAADPHLNKIKISITMEEVESSH